MEFWVQIHWIGMGLQITAALVGGGVSFWWFKVKNGGILVSPERAKWTKRLSYILLWMLALGFILELCYERHLLG